MILFTKEGRMPEEFYVVYVATYVHERVVRDRVDYYKKGVYIYTKVVGGKNAYTPSKTRHEIVVRV